MARLLDSDPITKKRTLFHWDETDAAATIETLQDVEDLVEDNRGFYNLHDERTPWKGDMHRVASIPIALYWDLHAKGIVQDEKRFRAWLNDRENIHFRTRPGRV